MPRSKIPEDRLLLDDHPILSTGQRLFNTDDPEKPRWTAEKLGLHIAGKKAKAGDIVRADKPDATPLFVLVKDVIPEAVWRPAYKVLRTVSGSLANRPDIIGENLRQPQFKKNGELGNYNAASPAITDAFGGNAICSAAWNSSARWTRFTARSWSQSTRLKGKWWRKSHRTGDCMTRLSPRCTF
jgi:hypothetical protein